MTKTKGENDGNSTARKRKIMLKSRNNGNRAFVTFFNKTSRLIDVIWVNFEGAFTTYTPHGLLPGKKIDMRTYEDHPWIFRDRWSGNLLVFCNKEGKHKEVYFPEPWDGSLEYRAPIINVILPVYDLKERCLQVVRKLVKKEDVSALGAEIPKTLQEDLVHQKPSQVLWTMEDVDDDEDS